MVSVDEGVQHVEISMTSHTRYMDLYQLQSTGRKSLKIKRTYIAVLLEDIAVLLEECFGVAGSSKVGSDGGNSR